MQTRNGLLILVSLITILSINACTKSDDNTNVIDPNFKLSYGDSIFYLNNQSGDYIVSPTVQKRGTYIGFPEGVEIDDNTGAINVSKSESGLRYKISFIPEGTTDTFSTKIVISGINFFDKIYNLSNGDTIAHAIYNASAQPYVPGGFGTGTNNIFDDGGGCNGQKCAVSLVDGSINLAKTIRDGALPLINDAQKEFEYVYRIDDRSQKAVNKLKVKLYYYDTQADIQQYLLDIFHDREGTLLRTGSTQRVAKPRPPCVVIVGH